MYKMLINADTRVSKQLHRPSDIN